MVLGLLLAALVIVEGLQVLGRYFFGVGFIWVQPVISLLLLTLGWLGGAYLWYTKAHLYVELLPLPEKYFSHWVPLIADIMMISVLVVLLPAMSDAITAYSRLQLEGLPLPASVRLYPCYVALLLIGLGAMLNLLECVARVKGQTG